MFPESVSNSEVLPKQGATNQTSNVQRLATASQMVKTAISNLINYQVSLVGKGPGLWCLVSVLLSTAGQC